MTRPAPGTRRPLGSDERQELARRGILAQPGWCTDGDGGLWIRSMGRRRRWVPAGTEHERTVARPGLLRVAEGRA